MARPSGARPVHLRATAPILALCAALPLLTGCLATDAPRRRPIWPHPPTFRSRP